MWKDRRTHFAVREEPGGDRTSRAGDLRPHRQQWALLIVNALGGGTLRFTELRTAVSGISHKMLTQTLRGLERDGLLDRHIHPTVPPRVDYTLTDMGHELRDKITGLCAWTRGNTSRIQAARQRFDGGPVSGADERDGLVASRRSTPWPR
jgi:DNA-binding HxlR family transcriptional regulator